MPEPDLVANYPDAGIYIEYFDHKHYYHLNGQYVPSPSTINGILDKPLDAYIERRTLEGAWTLLHRAGYDIPSDNHPDVCPWHTRMITKNGRTVKRYPPAWAKDCKPADPDNHVCSHAALCQFRVDLKERHLSSMDFTRAAADRGTGVHQTLEDWAESEKIPNPQDFPPDQRGFVRGLSAFLLEWQPRFLESETMVGSKIHGFAGRRDSVVTIDAGELPEAVRSTLPESARDGGPILLDLKTGKGVYPTSHFRQLIAYEIAGSECGATPTVAQGIVSVNKSGRFRVVWSTAKPEHFLNLLQVWRDNRELEPPRRRS